MPPRLPTLHADGQHARDLRPTARAGRLREGNAPLDVGPQPMYIGADLDAIADQLIEHYPASATVDGKKSPHAFSNH